MIRYRAPNDVFWTLQELYWGGAGGSVGEIARRCEKQLSGNHRSTLWFTGAHTSLQNATFWHRTVGSALDIDDGHRMAVGHPEGVVIPAAYAVSEAQGRTCRELIEAMVCGYEVAIRSGNIHVSETSKFAVMPGTG